jgi:hypothetical protein
VYVAVWGRLHATPQPPQFAGSLVTFTHAPLQFVKPALHVTVHDAPLQPRIPFGTFGHGEHDAPHVLTSDDDTHIEPHRW